MKILLVEAPIIDLGRNQNGEAVTPSGIVLTGSDGKPISDQRAQEIQQQNDEARKDLDNTEMSLLDLIKKVDELKRKSGPTSKEFQNKQTELKNKLSQMFSNKELLTNEGTWDVIFQCLTENKKPLDNQFIKMCRTLKTTPKEDRFQLFYKMWKTGEIGPDFNNKNNYLNSESFWNRSTKDFQFTARIMDQLTSDAVNKYFEDAGIVTRNFNLLFNGSDLKPAGLNQYKTDKNGVGLNIFTIIDQWQKSSGKKDDTNQFKSNKDISKQDRQTLSTILDKLKKGKLLSDKENGYLQDTINKLIITK